MTHLFEIKCDGYLVELPAIGNGWTLPPVVGTVYGICYWVGILHIITTFIADSALDAFRRLTLDVVDQLTVVFRSILSTGGVGSYVGASR